MPLFGSKTDVTIDVDRDQVVAGEELRVSAQLGELDKKAQGGRIELGYRNTYLEDDTDSDGDRTTRRRTSDVVVATEHLRMGAGETPGHIDATFSVPADAPGSAEGSIAWFVRAVVDRKRARDANAERALTVLVPATPLEAWAQLPAKQSSKCAMELTASTRVAKPGDTISGTLTLSPHQALSARAVRVQLKRERNDPDNNKDGHDFKLELCGETELTAGETRTLDYAIDVPVGAPPSFRAQYNHQHWYLEGVVDIPRSGDADVRLELVVHTA